MTGWRSAARPIIAAIIREYSTDDIPRLRAALRDAFPWGERRYHPYKVWLDEIRVQLGLKHPQRLGPRTVDRQKLIDEGQRELPL